MYFTCIFIIKSISQSDLLFLAFLFYSKMILFLFFMPWRWGAGIVSMHHRIQHLLFLTLFWGKYEMLTYTDHFCETIHVWELLIYSYQKIIALLGKSYIALDSACYSKVKSSKLNFYIDLFFRLKVKQCHWQCQIPWWQGILPLCF